MIEQYDGRREIVLLDSMNEVDEYISRRNTSGHYTSSKYERSDKWYKTESLAEARELLRYGWHDGLALLQDSISEITSKVTQLTEQEDYNYNPVEGIGIDIGRYTSGQPDCWLAVDPMPVNVKGNRVLRIVYNAFFSGATDQKAIATYGGMIAGTIAALEMQGYRCELWSIMIGKVDLSGNRQAAIGYCVKQANEELNLARLAFSCAHPSSFRRIIFALMERAKTQFSAAYCYPLYETEAPEFLTDLMAVDVYFPTVNSYCKYNVSWSTVDASKVAADILSRYQ